MAEEIPLQWQVKILDLEDEVRGLRETVNQLYKLWSLAHMGVPKPDQYVQEPPSAGYTVEDVEARMAAMNLRPRLPVDDGAPAIPPAFNDTAVDASAETPAENGTLTTNKVVKTSLTPEQVSELPLYTYSPLNEASSEVRFLALTSSKESTDNEPISCRIVTASLDDAPTDRPFNPSSAIELYNPLSYCWGNAEASKEIILDGCLFRVRPSLYDALAHFRQTELQSSDAFWHGPDNTEETYWWVDAICINQEDLEERKSQVALMSRLYRAAHTVRVWLGQEEDNSALAMDVVRKLAYRPDSPEEEQSWDYSRDNPGKTHRPGGPGRRMIEISQPDAGAPVSDLEKTENYNALVKLFQRPWFSRVWIQQEAALPQNVEVHCGQQTCSWHDLTSTVDLLAYLVDECHLPGLQSEGLRENLSSFVSCFYKARAIGTLRKDVIQDGESYGEFEDLVSKCRNCLATDPRDKVYALLPMTSPDEFEFAADYAKDKRTMYTDMVMKLLERGSLSFMQWCQNPTGSTGLPSWVPDLEAPWGPLPIERLHEDIAYTDDDESSGREAPVDFNYIEAENKLEVKGIIFDSVGAINQSVYVAADTSNDDVRNIVLDWQQFNSDQRAILQEQWQAEAEAHDEDDGDFRDGDDICTSIYGNIIEAEDEEWREQVTNHMRNRDLSRHEWDDDEYGDFDTAAIDNDPVLRLFKRYLPMGDAPLSNYLGRKSQFYPWFRALSVGRRFMTTSKGGSGLVPENAQVGDALCFFAGCGTPFVIRAVGDGEWAIVGVARKYSWALLRKLFPITMLTIF